MKKYVIYSAMVGAYDDILQPQVVDERFDYILFSNEIKEKHVGIWEVRSITYHNNDNTRICRYVKTHPEELLKEYEMSVWMDSNVQIQTDSFYKGVVELEEKDVPISSMWHPTRHCIYEEAFAVMRMCVEHEEVVTKWCHKLRKEGYPRNIGLFETCVLYRKHTNEKVKKVDALWWQCIDNNSRRDQLSYNYSLWKVGAPMHYLLGEGEDVNKATCVHRIAHKDQQHNDCPPMKNEAWMLRHIWKHPEDTHKIEELYYQIYVCRFPLIWTAVIGQFYRIKDRLKSKK